MAAAALSPASHGAGGKAASGFVSKAPEDMSPEVRSLVSTLAAFKASKTYLAIKASLDKFDDDAVYDTPFMYIHGRDRIRVISCVFGVLGATLVDPKVVRIYLEAADKRAVVEVDGTGHYMPTRTWWVLPSMLLPHSIPHETSLMISVKSWSDKVDKVRERFHNLPALPFIMRWALGQGVGTTLRILEPAALAMYDIYQNAWVNISQNTSSVTSAISDSTSGAIHAIKSD